MLCSVQQGAAFARVSRVLVAGALASEAPSCTQFEAWQASGPSTPPLRGFPAQLVSLPGISRCRAIIDRGPVRAPRRAAARSESPFYLSMWSRWDAWHSTLLTCKAVGEAAGPWATRRLRWHRCARQSGLVAGSALGTESCVHPMVPALSWSCVCARENWGAQEEPSIN